MVCIKLGEVFRRFLDISDSQNSAKQQISQSTNQQGVPPPMLPICQFADSLICSYNNAVA